jgi:hypothetical protein
MHRHAPAAAALAPVIALAMDQPRQDTIEQSKRAAEARALREMGFDGPSNKGWAALPTKGKAGRARKKAARARARHMGRRNGKTR